MATRDEIEHVLRVWRAGERLAHRTPSLAWRLDYERAIETVLGHLQRYATMADLVAAYFGDVPGKASRLDAACHTRSGRLLNVGIVEDAAFWRRVRQLVARRQAGQ